MLRARTIAELRDALRAARAHAGGPVVVHVETDRYAGVPSDGPGGMSRSPRWAGDAVVARASTRRRAGASARTSTPAGSERDPALRIPPAASGADGTITVVTPASAGWSHVGFEALLLEPGRSAERDTGARECCVVVIAGHATSGPSTATGGTSAIAATPFAGAPDAAYLPPRTRFAVEGAGDGGEVGLCFAPAGAARPRAPAARGRGAARGARGTARTRAPSARS